MEFIKHEIESIPVTEIEIENVGESEEDFERGPALIMNLVSCDKSSLKLASATGGLPLLGPNGPKLSISSVVTEQTTILPSQAYNSKVPKSLKSVKAKFQCNKGFSQHFQISSGTQNPSNPPKISKNGLRRLTLSEKIEPKQGDSACTSLIDNGIITTPIVQENLLKIPSQGLLYANQPKIKLSIEKNSKEFIPLTSSMNCHDEISDIRRSVDKISKIEAFSFQTMPPIDTNIDYEELLNKHPQFSKYFEEKVAKAKEMQDKKLKPLDALLMTVIGMPHAQRLTQERLMELE